MVVYVVNKHGVPLMPCSPRKARILLKQKKAKVIKTVPFTIKLMYGSSGYKQPLTLGIDTGSSKVGSAVVSQNGIVNPTLFVMSDQFYTNSEKLLLYTIITTTLNPFKVP